MVSSDNTLAAETTVQFPEKSDPEDAWEDLKWGVGGEVSGEALIAPARRTADGRVSRQCSVVYCRTNYRLNSGRVLAGIARFRGDGTTGPTQFTFETSPGELFDLMLPPAPDFILSGNGPAALDRLLPESALPVFPLEVICDVRFEHAPESRGAVLDRSGLILHIRDDAVCLDETVNVGGLFGEELDGESARSHRATRALSNFCLGRPVVTNREIRARFPSVESGLKALSALRPLLQHLPRPRGTHGNKDAT